jgi:hypothetical protein
MVVLLISGLLGLLPLLGIAYIVMTSNGITVDALFMSLILLTISGIFFLNIGLELLARRKAAMGGQAGQGRTTPASSGWGTAKPAAGTHMESGVVEAVAFYETEVGRPDKSLVTFRSANGGTGKTLVFSGDLRNALPAGKRVKITYAAGAEGNRLVAVGD